MPNNSSKAEKREKYGHVLVVVTPLGIAFGTQNLFVAFNFDKQDVIDFTKSLKPTMFRASEADSLK